VCGKPVRGQTAEQIARELGSLPEGTRLVLMAPILVNRKGEHRELLAEVRKAGYVRLRINGEMKVTEEVEALDKRRKHTVEAVIDRLIVKPDAFSRLNESVETALRVGDGLLIAATEGGGDRVFSEKMACGTCGASFPELTPQSFSFNSPQGMCVECNGLGTRVEIDPGLVVPDESLSIDAGAIKPWGPNVSEKTGWSHGFRGQILAQLGIDFDRPYAKLPERQRELLLHGAGDRTFAVKWEGRSGRGRFRQTWEGLLPRLERRFREATSESAKSHVPRTRCFRKRLRAPGAGAGTSTATRISPGSSTVSVRLRGPRKNCSIGTVRGPDAPAMTTRASSATRAGARSEGCDITHTPRPSTPK